MPDAPPKHILARVFSEVHKREPKIVAKTRRKFGKKRAEEQRQAIAFSKARKIART